MMKFAAFRHFAEEIFNLVKSQTFIVITVIGNGMIGLAGFVFYHVESGVNPKLHHFIDALWWSFATATTTGYGDITPVTFFGKVLGISLMLVGTAIFAMYTGLFAEALLQSEKFKRK